MNSTNLRTEGLSGASLRTQSSSSYSAFRAAGPRGSFFSGRTVEIDSFAFWDREYHRSGLLPLKIQINYAWINSHQFYPEQRQNQIWWGQRLNKLGKIQASSQQFHINLQRQKYFSKLNLSQADFYSWLTIISKLFCISQLQDDSTSCSCQNIICYHIMKKQSFCQTAKGVILKLDFFCSTQFLRYNSEAEYATFTGAICSLIIVVTFLAIFMNVLISTINRTQITYTMNTIDQSANPLHLDTSINSSNKFMFAVGVGGFDINDPVQRFFDISFTLVSSINKIKSKVSIPLQPCTVDKWNISDDIVSTYNRMNFDKLLCAPQNITISLQGKFSQNIFNYAQLEVKKCNNSLNLSRPCANDTYILSHLSGNSFYTNFYFINSLINPNNEEPISYYLEDRNYIQFNYQYGGLTNLFVSKYQITTDNSIWPLEENRVYEGGYSNDLGQFIGFQHDGSTLAQFFLRRASTNVEVSRQYTKLDSTLSYIGGLFGFIMAALLFMSKYTQCCYEIDVGARLYNQDQEKEVDKDNFNLFWYLGYLAYWILGQLGCKCQWQRMKEYDHCRQQMQQQLDVCFLFERLNFLERSLQMLFTDQQYKLLHLRRKPTISDAVQLRQHYIQLQRLKQDTKQDFLHSQQNPAENTFNQLLATQNSPQKVQSQQYSSERSESPLFSGLKHGMKVVKKSSLKGDAVSKKIVESIDQKVAAKIEEQVSQSNQSEQKESNYPEKVSLELSKQVHELQHAIQSENTIRIEPRKEQSPFTFIE